MTPEEKHELGLVEDAIYQEYIEKEIYPVIHATLEAAAKVCDAVNNYDNPMTARDCADSIRALDHAEILKGME